MNLNKEKYILDRFKTCYHSFPEGEINKSEKPDFIIKSNKKGIGIEITEIFQDSHEGHSKYQQRSSNRHDFSKKNHSRTTKVGRLHFSCFNTF